MAVPGGSLKVLFRSAHVELVEKMGMAVFWGGSWVSQSTSHP